MGFRIQEDPEQKGSYHIQNLSATTLCAADDIPKLFEKADESRSSSSILEYSGGLSHKIFIVNVHTRSVSLPGEEYLKTGKLYFVNVAGVENLKRVGKASRKGASLNQSLNALTHVTKALEERNGYIPYKWVFYFFMYLQIRLIFLFL